MKINNKGGHTQISIVDFNGINFFFTEDLQSKALELFFGLRENPLSVSFLNLKEIRNRLSAILKNKKSPKLILQDINLQEFELSKSKDEFIEFIVKNKYTITLDHKIGKEVLDIIDSYLSVGFLPKEYNG